MVRAIAGISEYELERGKPMPSQNHGIVQTNIAIELSKFKKRYRMISEISLDLNGWLSTPDIGIFPRTKISFSRDRIRLTEPPLGVIEILSPPQSIQDLYDKIETYFLEGVRSVWLVIPTVQSIAVYRAPDDYTMFSVGTLTDTILDISVDLDAVFEEE
jgi:Uma2 family endonuclease